MDRRNLIKKGTLAGAAMVLPAADVLAERSSRSVIAALAGYSENVRSGVGADGIRLLASIDDLKAFADPAVRAKALPYGDIRAEGNLLSFRHGGTSYTLENVLPQHFEARARTLG